MDDDDSSFAAEEEEEEEEENPYDLMDLRSDFEDSLFENENYAVTNRYSSWNELHAKLSFIMTIWGNTGEGWWWDYDYFSHLIPLMEKCRILMRNNPELLKERCSVTGKTPLMCLFEGMEISWRSEGYLSVFEQVVKPLATEAIRLGADVNCCDFLGRHVIDYVAKNSVVMLARPVGTIKPVIKETREDVLMWEKIFIPSLQFLLDKGANVGSLKKWLWIYPELPTYIPQIKGDKNLDTVGQAEVFDWKPIVAMYCEEAGVKYAEHEIAGYEKLLEETLNAVYRIAICHVEYRRSHLMQERDVLTVLDKFLF